MRDESINSVLLDRIEFAESLFKQSDNYEINLKKWQDLNFLLEQLLQENGLQKEAILLDDLFQELLLGAAKYGYLTGYQDSRHRHIESSYSKFIEHINKDYVKSDN